jgi:long-chain acyl-CoA synthetase
MSVTDRIINALCERLVRRKISSRFGGALTYFVSGGAALNPEIARFFTRLGVGILQGYGQTEASPVISVNRPGHVRLDTVGPPLSGVEVRLSEAGELLVRGPLVMQGYWKQPEATEKTVIDGWLHTGDLAAIDPDGHIRIVGRLKDLIINSGGENIAPAPIEQALMFQSEIEQAVVGGEGRAWLSALIYPSEAVRDHPDSIEERVREAVKRVNASLPIHHHIRKWVLMETPASVENGLLTPTQKLKRHALISAYVDALDALYHR